MSKYSSDSDSSSYKKKSRRKRRSSTSSSGSSRHRRSKSSKRHRSSRYKKSKDYNSRSYRRSRSQSKTSSRHSRSSSKDLRTRRSRSRDKYRHKHHYKSHLHSKAPSSNYHSRSTSSESKNSSSSSSTSKSSSNTSNKKNFPSNTTTNPEEQLREKLLKAIKAAESADHQLKQQGVLPKGVKSRNDISNFTQGAPPSSDVINDINSDVFVQKLFTSSKQKKEGAPNELNNPSAVEESNSMTIDENSIFHASFFIDPKAKLDRWIKKLHQIRQRAISGEPLPQ